MQASFPSTTASFAAGTPFRNAEEVWFWFICAVEARAEGAVPGKGRGDIQRPCEPTDIYKILERLYRGRRLRMDHMNVLSHYGRRRMAPEPFRKYEMRAATLWCEAMRELDIIFQRRGIVRNPLQITEVL